MIIKVNIDKETVLKAAATMTTVDGLPLAALEVSRLVNVIIASSKRW